MSYHSSLTPIPSPFYPQSIPIFTCYVNPRVHMVNNHQIQLYTVYNIKLLIVGYTPGQVLPKKHVQTNPSVVSSWSVRYLFPNSLSSWGLQPRIARVCTGAGAGSSSTRFTEKVWEALVQSQVRSNAIPERFRRRVQEALVQSQDGSGEGRGGFGAEPG